MILHSPSKHGWHKLQDLGQRPPQLCYDLPVSRKPAISVIISVIIVNYRSYGEPATCLAALQLEAQRVPSRSS
jgi:hypothetical protein